MKYTAHKNLNIKAAKTVTAIQVAILQARVCVLDDVESDGQIEAADNLLIMIESRAEKLQSIDLGKDYADLVIETNDLLDASYRLLELLGDDRLLDAMTFIAKAEVKVQDLIALTADDCHAIAQTSQVATMTAEMH